jgi:hypothetical protein
MAMRSSYIQHDRTFFRASTGIRKMVPLFNEHKTMAKPFSSISASPNGV